MLRSGVRNDKHTQHIIHTHTVLPLENSTAKTANKGIYSQAVPNAASFYSSSGWADDLALAAAMMYVANPSSAALTEAKTLYDQWVNTGAGWESWDWDNAQWGATYILQKYDPTHTNSRNKLEWLVNQWLNKPRTPKVGGFC